MGKRRTEIKVTTTGSAGSASGSTSKFVGIGEIVELYLNFHASAPATTDTTVAATGDPLAKTLLTVTNSATDAYYRPSELWDDATGVDVTGAARGAFVHNGYLTIALAQCDALTDAVTATVWVDE